MKIRGYRVEVAEIELALLDLDPVQEAVVMARQDQPGDPRLVAYIVPQSPAMPSVATLRQALAATLPAPMVPAAFVILDALPHTPTGKVDRRALPAPERGRPVLSTLFVAPRTPIEAKLAKIWADVLGLERVGIHDDFLALGGDSLLATRLITRVRDTLRVDIPLRLLLDAPTCADMAVVVTRHQTTQLAPGELDAIVAEVEALSEEDARQRLGDRGPEQRNTPHV